MVALKSRKGRERAAEARSTEERFAAQRLTAIVEDSDDAIISKDLDGTVTSWNPAAQRIFGYAPEEIVGRSIITIIPPRLRDEERAILERLRRGERVGHFETIRVTKDGREVAISLCISPIKDPSGRVIGASKSRATSRKRNRRKRPCARAQCELQRRTDDLELRVQKRTLTLQQTVSELESFSYSLSHDMRAPLRAIQSYSQIVLDDCREHISPSCVAYLHKVVGSAERLDRLILDLLAFSRLSREEVAVQPVDPEKLARGIIQERAGIPVAQRRHPDRGSAPGGAGQRGLAHPVHHQPPR